MKLRYEGDPIAKGWPRLGKHGVYNEQAALANRVSVEYFYQMREKGYIMLPDAPLEFKATFGMPIPGSWYQTRRDALDGEWCPKNKDVDNIAKFFLDTLNKVAYSDDRLVSRLVCEKVYSLTPYVDIEITELWPKNKPLPSCWGAEGLLRNPRPGDPGYKEVA